MSKFIATWFYSGLLPKAPGTWGSLAALPFVYLMIWLGFGWIELSIAVALSSLIGWWAIIQETKGKENHDPGEIVIDEVAGQWLTFLPLFAIISFADTNLSDINSVKLTVYVALGFILFRIFDITKIGPVGWADKKDTAWGVMLDDLIAGILAAFVWCMIYIAQTIYLN